jgi:hypothetical protein
MSSGRALDSSSKGQFNPLLVGDGAGEVLGFLGREDADALQEINEPLKKEIKKRTFATSVYIYYNPMGVTQDDRNQLTGNYEDNRKILENAYRRKRFITKTIFNSSISLDEQLKMKIEKCEMPFDKNFDKNFPYRITTLSDIKDYILSLTPLETINNITLNYVKTLRVKVDVKNNKITFIDFVDGSKFKRISSKKKKASPKKKKASSKKKKTLSKKSS